MECIRTIYNGFNVATLRPYFDLNAAQNKANCLEILIDDIFTSQCSSI